MEDEYEEGDGVGRSDEKEGDGVSILDGGGEQPAQINKWWRNFVFDDNLKKFVYGSDFDDEINEGDVPAADQYKVVNPCDCGRVEVLVDGGREQMVAVMAAEYDSLLSSCERLGIPQTDEGVFRYLFGRESRMAQAIRRSLDLTDDQLSQFLATFYASSEWGVPAKRLEMDKRFIYEGFMDQKAFNDIWKQIGDKGKDRTEIYF